MWDNRNRVLHETEHSVARDLQIQQITAEFDMGPAGLAPGRRKSPCGSSSYKVLINVLFIY
jgi:hypothetical protein